MMSVVEFLSQPVWHRLSLTLVHFLWQGVVVATIACAAVRMLRLKHGNPRYATFLLALVAMAVCPLITFLALHTPVESTAITPEPIPTVESAGPVPSSMASELPQPLNEDPVTVSPTHHVPLRETLDGMAQAALPWALACWMGGVVVLSVRLLFGFIGVRRWRRGLEPLPGELAARVHVLSERLGLPGFSRVFLSGRATEAVALGYLRPTVLLPAAMVTHMPAEMLEAVIAHELAHIRRFDLWVNLAQRVIETLLFYHPAVWWLSNRLRAERELCCDELAVQATGERLTYASALESAGRVRLGIRQPALAVALGQDRKSTLSRVRHVLGLPPAPSDSRFWLAGVIAVILLALLAMPAVPALTASAATQTASESRQVPEPAKSIHQAAAAGNLEQVNKLLAQGADVNAKDEEGRTPLHRAAWHGRKDVVEVLLARGANVNEADGSGQTPLHLAADFGAKFVPEFLLAKGAQINARDKAGNTPLHAAAGRWSLSEDLLELLIAKGADVRARNEAGQTPLHRVSMIGRLDRSLERPAEVLLALGAEIDAKDKDGRTPLHFAVERGHRELVDLLLAKGADIEAKNAEGRTALHLAMFEGSTRPAMVELLVNRGANVNSVARNGITPLHLAAARGDNETVERLLAKGADVNAKDAHGVTPALQAALLLHRDTVTLLLSKGADTSIQLAACLGDLARVKGFLANGVDVNTPDANSVTPLHAAARGGQKEVAEFLLSKGALVNAESAVLGGTALHHAAIAVAGSKEVAELLIRKGAEIDAKNNAGMTALFYALIWRNTDTARLLIAHGADVNAKSQNDGTPLHYAAWSGSKDLVLLLLDHGADVNAKFQNDGTPLHYAARRGSKDLVQLLLDRGADVNAEIRSGSKDLVQLLLGRGADVNAEIAPRWRPLDDAVRGGHKDVAKLLIDKGADTVRRDDLLFRACMQVDKDLAELLIRKGADVNSQAWGYAPAMQAMFSGNTSATKPADIPKLIGILKLLLDNGADPDAKDRYDWSLLHYACGEEFDLAKLLLDKGANPNAVENEHGWRPLHWAADGGRTAVVELLISRGADVNARDFHGHTALSYAEDVGDTDILGLPRKTHLTAEAKAAKKEVTRILREHGAKE